MGNPKTDFVKIIEPHCEMTTAAVEEYKIMLSVGDTTFLDYRNIKEKREGYGPTGKGGNGLILHSAWVRPLVDKSWCNQGSTGNPY